MLPLQGPEGDGLVEFSQLPNFWTRRLQCLWSVVDFTYQRIPFTSSTKIDSDCQANWIRPDFSGRGLWGQRQPVISMWLPKAWGYCKETTYNNLKPYTGSSINRGFWSLGNRLQMWWVATKALIMRGFWLCSDAKRSVGGGHGQLCAKVWPWQCSQPPYLVHLELRIHCDLHFAEQIWRRQVCQTTTNPSYGYESSVCFGQFFHILQDSCATATTCASASCT